MMESRGLTPGPRAYHSYIFAFVRASAVNDALDVTRKRAEAGE